MAKYDIQYFFLNFKKYYKKNVKHCKQKNRNFRELLRERQNFATLKYDSSGGTEQATETLQDQTTETFQELITETFHE